MDPLFSQPDDNAETQPQDSAEILPGAEMQSGVEMLSDAEALPVAEVVRPLTAQECALVEKYYPHVCKVVMRMRHHLPACADLEELQSAGITGLIAAVRRYSAEQSHTFEAYAVMRIRGAVLDELRRLDSLPRSSRIEAKRLRGTENALEQRLGRAPTDAEMSHQLGMNQADYSRLQTRTRPVHFIPLDQPLQNGNGRLTSLHDSLPDEDTTPTPNALEQTENRVELAEKIKLLPERHQKVISLYYFEGLRLAEIAARFGVTEARICQIHGQALELLRQKWPERN